MTRTTSLGNRTSTVLGRRLGGELLRLRDGAGLTQRQAAEAINATNSKIVKMEQGWVPMRDPDIRVLCEFYGVEDPEVLARLLALAKLDRERRKAKGWWLNANYNKGRGFLDFVALEDGASRIRNWQISLIPGLLQTAAYTRAMAVVNPSWDDLDEIEMDVEVKQKRQRRLVGENPVQLHAVMWEGALRQQFGGRDVMRGQMERLLEVSEFPNVRLQVLPFRHGAHPGVSGPFVILSYAETGALDVVESDTHRDMMWMENEECAYFNELFDRISRHSLSPHDSIALIESLHKES
ncbi:helix-turn-helix domain-containing protein [Streptomyces acidiscabies]|uniref:helix-turn-helix domain-containing protein n=1 Tax=Streptomyces acidiscabies TaxID=42234 RepID=UPI001F286BAB|nr:helix-turn-helix transcriptional regulator [Streptomyces acidiscabies]